MAMGRTGAGQKELKKRNSLKLEPFSFALRRGSRKRPDRRRALRELPMGALLSGSILLTYPREIDTRRLRLPFA